MEWQRYRRHVLRYVERQSLITTSELVDSQADQIRLEELLEASKPPLGDAHGLHWLLRSPFRYPPLPHGSRFGARHERGIFYASETRTALEAEAAFYSFKFFQDMVEPPPSPIRRELTIIRVKLTTDHLVDLSDHAALDRLGFATSGELAAFWASITPVETKAWCATALARGEITEIDITNHDGSTRRCFARPETPDLAGEIAPPPGRRRSTPMTRR